MDDEPVTTEEAAGICGVHRSTITRWVSEGTLTPVKRFKGKTGPMLFSRQSLAEAVAKRAEANAVSDSAA